MTMPVRKLAVRSIANVLDDPRLVEWQTMFSDMTAVGLPVERVTVVADESNDIITPRDLEATHERSMRIAHSLEQAGWLDAPEPVTPTIAGGTPSAAEQSVLFRR